MNEVDEDEEARREKRSGTRWVSRAATVPALVYWEVFLAAALPAVVSIVASSDMTPLGRYVFGAFVSDKVHWLVRGVELSIALILIGYLFDIHTWRSRGRAVAMYAYYGIAGVLALGILFHTREAPSIPIMVGIGCSVISVVALRRTLCTSSTGEQYALAGGISFFVVAMVSTTIWILWAFSPVLGGYNEWGHLKAGFAQRGFRTLTGFMIWCSPVVHAIGYLSIGLVLSMFSRFHTDTDGTVANEDLAYVGRELRVGLIVMGVLVLSGWVAASMAGTEMGLSTAVVRISSTIGVSMIAYVAIAIGRAKIEKIAETNVTIESILELMRSNWSKGLFILIMWPLVPIYFLFELLHQAVRKWMGNVPGKEGEGEAEEEEHLDEERKFYLPKQARANMAAMWEWEWSSVLSKAMWVGILYFTVQVGVAKGLTMFLSWINQQISPWPLWAILLCLFVLGMVLFLLPPVPGVPIYLVSGIVVTQRCINDGWSFYFGCAVAVIFCFVLKLTAVALQQKAIGEQFSDNITVKKTIGVQTPTMKAVKHILSQRGLKPDKVAVLVGGPDWPTSVLTGILKLRIADMLLGTTPCFFLIFPIVLASAFMIRAAEVPEKAEQYQCIANVMLMIGAVVQTGSMAVAGFYMESVKAEYSSTEFPEGPDPQEDDVIHAQNTDDVKAKRRSEMTSWVKTPWWLRGVLLLGTFFMSMQMNILFLPLPIKPFRKYTLSMKISDLPGGSVLGVINPSGWAAIGFFSASCVCLTIYTVWCGYQMRALHFKGEPNEKTALLQEEARLRPGVS